MYENKFPIIFNEKSKASHRSFLSKIIIPFIFLIIVYFVYLRKFFEHTISSKVFCNISCLSFLVVLFILIAIVNFSYTYLISRPSLPKRILKKNEKILFILLYIKIKRYSVIKPLFTSTITKVVITDKRIILPGTVLPLFLFPVSYPLENRKVYIKPNGNLYFESHSLELYTDHAKEILKELKKRKVVK